MWSSSTIRDAAQPPTRTLVRLRKFVSHSRSKMRVLFMQNPCRTVESLAAHVQEVPVRDLSNCSTIHSFCRLEIDDQLVSGSLSNGQVCRLVPTARSPNDFVQSRCLDHHPNGVVSLSGRGDRAGTGASGAKPVFAKSFVPRASINDERTSPRRVGGRACAVASLLPARDC